MGIKASSTRRTQASSAQSGTAVAIYTGGNSISVAGAVVSTATQVSLGLVTPGASSGSSTVTVASGPSITGIQYLDSNNNVVVGEIAVSTTGGNILINGSNFVQNSNVYINNTLVANTFISSSRLLAQMPSSSAGNAVLSVFLPTNIGTLGPNVRYSGAPVWTTSAASFSNGTLANITLSASSDSTLTYTLQAGSTLPNGISLVSSGYLSGTPTGYSTNSSGSIVVIATDLEGQATQQTINWTVISGDPQFTSTVFLLNGDSGTNTANNATNAVFLDSSALNATITKNGSVTQGSVSPYSQIGYSYYFGGSDYFTFTNSTGQGVNFGSSDFTVQLWYFMTNTTTNSTYHTFIRQDTATNGFDFGYRPSASQLVLGAGNVGEVTASTTLLANTWYHIAVSRSGTNLRFFVNGTQVGTTASNTFNFNVTGGTVRIGGNNYNAAYTAYGYISSLRATTTAEYTSNFTVPATALTAISNTTLLTCQGNRFKDSSAAGFALTTSGTPSVQPFSPFPASGTYAPSVHSGSIFCDGSTGYVTAPSNTNYNIDSGSTDSFICEFWVNFGTVGATMSIVDNGGLNGTSFQNWSIGLDASSIFQLVWGNSAAAGSQIGILSGTSVAKVGQWYHIALVKTNADWAMFVNGAREITYNGLNTAAKSSASPLSIGYGIATGAGGTRFKGYISNLRIYKGASASAPYAATSTTITVPTSPVTAITNTQLLLNGTNGGLIDSAGKFVFDSTTATPPSVTNAFTKFSNAINTTSKWMVNTSPNPNLILGTGDFTVECWIYWVATNYNGGAISLAASLTGQAIDIHTYSSTGYIYFAGLARSMGTLPVGTWNHYAIVRNNGVTKFYLDGVQNTTIGAVADTNNYATTYLQIGYYQANLASNTYIDDIRISRFARYTANFTPPAATFLGQ